MIVVVVVVVVAVVVEVVVVVVVVFYYFFMIIIVFVLQTILSDQTWSSEAIFRQVYEGRVPDVRRVADGHRHPGDMSAWVPCPSSAPSRQTLTAAGQ